VFFFFFCQSRRAACRCSTQPCNDPGTDGTYSIDERATMSRRGRTAAMWWRCPRGVETVRGGRADSVGRLRDTDARYFIACGLNSEFVPMYSSMESIYLTSRPADWAGRSEDIPVRPKYADFYVITHCTRQRHAATSPEVRWVYRWADAAYGRPIVKSGSSLLYGHDEGMRREETEME
jgi:hypothetical protein